MSFAQFLVIDGHSSCFWLTECGWSQRRPRGELQAMLEQLSVERKQKPCLTDTCASVTPGRNQEQVDSPLHPHQSAILFPSLKLGQCLITSSEGAFPFVQESAQWNRPTFQKHAVRCNVQQFRDTVIVYLVWSSVEHTQAQLQICCSLRSSAWIIYGITLLTKPINMVYVNFFQINC